MNKGQKRARHDVFEVVKVKERKSEKRMQWTKDFDAHLKSLIERNYYGSWKEISKAMVLRFPHADFTSKKCRARWRGCVDPSMKKHYLSNSEELVVLACHSMYKNQWAIIAHYLPRRHSNILRNSFHSMLRKYVKRVLKVDPLPLAITPLFFLQSIYVAVYIQEVVDLTELSETKNPVVPFYIYSFVNRSSMSQESLTLFLMGVRDKFVEFYSSRNKLKPLLKLSYRELTNIFIRSALSLIKVRITPLIDTADTFMLELIEHAIVLCSSNGESAICPPASTAKPAQTPLPFHSVLCQQGYMQCYTLGVTPTLVPVVSSFPVLPLSSLAGSHYPGIGSRIDFPGGLSAAPRAPTRIFD